MIAKHLIIQGKVQGVWFRASTKEKADQLKIRGVVRNLEDGNVEVYATGSLKEMEEFIQWCSQGPELANVTDVICNDCPLKDYTTFSILR